MSRRASLTAAVTIVALSACGPAGSPSTTATPSALPSAAAVGQPAAVTSFGLPLPAGTLAQLGSKRLHDDNFSSLTGTSGLVYTLVGSGADATSNPPGVPDASLDIIAIDPAAGTPVLPLAAGTVLAASPACQTVLVDHGNGTWVEYVHLQVSVTDGTPVAPSKELGTVMPVLPAGFVPPAGCSGLNSDAPHVHFAFLSGDDRTRQGHYLSMKGQVLCGYPVSPDGLLVGLVSAIQTNFTVPDCGQSGTPAAPSLSLPGPSQPNSAQLTPPSPTPAPTQAPTANPPPEPTPKTTPRPTPLAPPAAPTNVTVRGDYGTCLDPGICNFPITLHWAESGGTAQGFHVYAYKMGHECGATAWSVVGSRILVATVGSNARSWSGTTKPPGVDAKGLWGLRYSVSAFNGHGASREAVISSGTEPYKNYYGDHLDAYDSVNNIVVAGGGACGGATP